MNPAPSQARSGKEKLPERLHKDGRHILNQEDCYVATVERTDTAWDVQFAAELVRRWNTHEQMRKALASADDALDQIRNAQGNTLNPHHLSQIAYTAHNEIKAALAAGGSSHD